MITRRACLGGLGSLAVWGAGKPTTVLLRSGWQSVNIGDITHTPGALTLLEKAMPEAKVILWPGEIERGVEPMLMRRFPKLSIAKGTLDENGKPTTPELQAAFGEAQLCIHGSAAGVQSPALFESWHKLTGRPYGFLGIGFTFTGEAASTKGDDRVQAMLRGAKFVFARETDSLKNLTKAAIQGPQLGCCPDATFSFGIRDDARGNAYLKAEGLQPKRFIAVVPRLRLTPYHLIRKTSYSQEEIARRTQINEKWAEHDHAKLREAIVAYVRKTGNKVLLCPEMTYELDIIDPLLFRPLPDDVKRNVVVRKTYWLPDEAASIYHHASLVLSCECHSPIIAAAAGTPCMYVHQPEDGIKGRMYPDIGLSDWYFEVEQASGADIAARVLDVAGNPKAAERKVAEAVSFARAKQAEAMVAVKAAAGA